jgi:hypothetical protein
VLIIQYPQDESFDSDEDLEFRQELEQLADASLKESKLGHCDGGDIGNGKINVFCTVADGQRGCDAVVRALDSAGIEGAVIAFVEEGQEEDVDPRVLWPTDFAGTFSVL